MCQALCYTLYCISWNSSIQVMNGALLSQITLWLCSFFSHQPYEMDFIIAILQMKKKVKFKERSSNLLKVRHLLGRRADIKRRALYDTKEAPRTPVTCINVTGIVYIKIFHKNWEKIWLWLFCYWPKTVRLQWQDDRPMQSTVFLNSYIMPEVVLSELELLSDLSLITIL